MEAGVDAQTWVAQYEQPHDNDYWAGHKIISVSLSDTYIGFAGMALQDFLPICAERNEVYAMRFYGGAEVEGVDLRDNFGLFRIDPGSPLLAGLVDPVAELAGKIESIYWLPDDFWVEGEAFDRITHATQVLLLHDNVFGGCRWDEEGCEMVVSGLVQALLRLGAGTNAAEAIKAGAQELLDQKREFVACKVSEELIEFATVKNTWWNRITGKYKKLGEIKLTQSDVQYVGSV